MSLNTFAEKLQVLLKLSDTKNTVLANSVQYDLSYISKWLSGKALPSEKNIDNVIEQITHCVISNGSVRLMSEYSCDEKMLHRIVTDELHEAYSKSIQKKPDSNIKSFVPLYDVIGTVDENIWKAEKIVSVVDIMALPHEVRLILAGIRHGHFIKKSENIDYSMIISVNGNDRVYDSIFLIHLLTSMSELGFRLYNDSFAIGKLIYCIDDYTISSFLLPSNNDCFLVNEISNSNETKQVLNSLIDQEKLIFSETSIVDMMKSREYAQMLVSTNNRMLLGHITEHLLPKAIYDSLASSLDDTIDYQRMYLIFQNVMREDGALIMIYESAIANLIIDGVVDFYNQPIKLNNNQVFHCVKHLLDLIERGVKIKLIDGGFSDDFRYITNPCMFMSDSLCYLRLENDRYEKNILVLNDKTVKVMFDEFFASVWNNRQDVVTGDKSKICDKLNNYKTSAEWLTKT